MELSDNPPWMDGEEGDRVVACASLVGATGASELQIRFSDDEEPTVWIAVAKHGGHLTAHGGLTPIEAAFRLVEVVVDGGECASCSRPTGISDTWDTSEMPMEHVVCWWKYDASTRVFRRGCDGKEAGVDGP